MADTIYKKREIKEVDRFAELLKSTSDREHDGMLIFIQGMKFQKELDKGAVLCNQ